jgi:hypothetical protein
VEDGSIVLHEIDPIGSTVSAWMVTVVVLHVLRPVFLLSVKKQTPVLYDDLGKPPVSSRHSWGFVFNAARHPDFSRLTHGVRWVLRAMQVLFLVVIGLSVLFVFELIQAPWWKEMLRSQ